MQINITSSGSVQPAMPAAPSAPEITSAASTAATAVQHDTAAAGNSVPGSGAEMHAPDQSHDPQKQQAMLRESAEKFNKMSEELNLDVKFAYNDKIDQVYLNVIDKHTGRVIRKLPSEEAMKISESMKELVGALLDKRG